MTLIPSRPCQPGDPPDKLEDSFPTTWLQAAANLPGKSLHVGIALWHMARQENCRTLALSNRITHKFSVDRNSKYRALAWLEEAGLIQVRRKLGQSPVVTIIDAGSDGDDA